MIRLGKVEIAYINALQNASSVMARDCIVLHETIVFIVDSDEVGKAIGKEGKNAKQLSQRIKKNIQVYGQAENAEAFLRNAWKDISIEHIEVQDKKIFVRSSDRKKILQNKPKLQVLKEVIKRTYGIDEIIIK